MHREYTGDHRDHAASGRRDKDKEHHDHETIATPLDDVMISISGRISGWR
jgi:hypothetical protein